jgi:hypothetical protein
VAAAEEAEAGFFFVVRLGAVLTDVSPSENGERKDATTDRMIATETANHPPAES